MSRRHRGRCPGRRPDHRGRQRLAGCIGRSGPRPPERPRGHSLRREQRVRQWFQRRGDGIGSRVRLLREPRRSAGVGCDDGPPRGCGRRAGRRRARPVHPRTGRRARGAQCRVRTVAALIGRPLPVRGTGAVGGALAPAPAAARRTRCSAPRLGQRRGDHGSADAVPGRRRVRSVDVHVHGGRRPVPAPAGARGAVATFPRRACTTRWAVPREPIKPSAGTGRFMHTS